MSIRVPFSTYMISLKKIGFHDMSSPSKSELSLYFKNRSRLFLMTLISQY